MNLLEADDYLDRNNRKTYFQRELMAGNITPDESVTIVIKSAIAKSLEENFKSDRLYNSYQDSVKNRFRAMSNVDEIELVGTERYIAERLREEGFLEELAKVTENYPNLNSLSKLPITLCDENNLTFMAKATGKIQEAIEAKLLDIKPYFRENYGFETPVLMRSIFYIFRSFLYGFGVKVFCLNPENIDPTLLEHKFYLEKGDESYSIILNEICPSIKQIFKSLWPYLTKVNREKDYLSRDYYNKINSELTILKSKKPGKRKQDTILVGRNGFSEDFIESQYEKIPNEFKMQRNINNNLERRAQGEWTGY